MRYRKRNMPYREKIRLRIGALLFITIIGLLITALIKLNKSLKPVASAQAEHYAVMMTSKIMEKTVSDYISDNSWSCNDFAMIVYNGDGEPSAVEINSCNVNKVQAELALRINTELEKASRSYNKIPLGSLTDSYLLSGKGPEVKIRICPVESVQVNIESKFDSSGINQTRHIISAVITADINSSIPLYKFDTKVKFNYLLAENVIIGSVPNLEAYRLHQ